MEDHLLVSESSDSDLVRASNKEDWEDTHRSGSSTDDDGPGEQVTSCSRYCINCTGQMGDEDATVCEDCGHHIDANLFDRDVSSTAHLGSCNAKVALLYDERMELHEDRCSPPHPERPDRIRAVMARLRASGLGARCNRVTCREASISELAAVHTGSLIQLVQDASHKAAMFPGSNVSITPDTYVNQHTFLCARLAAGGAAQVAGMVARGEAPHGAAIVRPPGHHAESGMAMGFCFFNNAAVAARAAQAAGARRVVILDWDIHHGNGTQHIFEDDPSVLYMSLHRYDGGSFYPGTGAAEEAGVDEGEGFTVNVPWDSADMGNGDYLAAFHQVLVPIVYEYNPDLIIVSAGFDAADGDPIGECRVTPECFGHMTSMLKAVAPLVLLLEGGYNLHSTAVSTEACLRVLLGEEPGNLPGARYPSAFGCKAIQQAVQVQSQYWRCLRHGATAGGWVQGRLHTDSLCANVGLSMELAAEPQPSETMQLSCKNGMASSAAGPDRDVSSPGCRRQAGGSPRRGAASGLRSAAVKRKMLVAIHKRAMRAFWKRQRRLANQLPAVC